MVSIKKLHLEPLSKALARKFVDEFPELEASVGKAEKEQDGLLVNVLYVIVPSAHPQITAPMEIQVALDRIVSAHWFTTERFRWGTDWVYYHVAPHFGDNSPRPWESDPSGIERVVEWLRAFFNEQIVAFYLRDSDQTMGAGYCEPDAVQGYVCEGREITVRSWRGTYDNVLKAP
jgi:hypothetical protein